jgi:hypothetical protein
MQFMTFVKIPSLLSTISFFILPSTLGFCSPYSEENDNLLSLFFLYFCIFSLLFIIYNKFTPQIKNNIEYDSAVDFQCFLIENKYG